MGIRSNKEVMQFMHNHVKETIGDAVKPLGFKFKKTTGGYELLRNTSKDTIKDRIGFTYDGLNYYGIPVFVSKNYRNVQDLILPVISKRYPKYQEQVEQERTIFLQYYFDDLPIYKEKYYLIAEPLSSSVDEEEIPRKIAMVKDYIMDVVIPELDKMNDLNYLHNWLMSIINVGQGVSYWGALQTWDQYQFHGFKHMAISKLIGGLDYEKVCAKMEEFIDGCRNDTEPKYTNLKPTYEDLREYLDKWENKK